LIRNVAFAVPFLSSVIGIDGDGLGPEITTAPVAPGCGGVLDTLTQMMLPPPGRTWR
jgi:hypothetical protein